MSNIAAQAIAKVKDQAERFKALDKANGFLLDFEKECLFARQQLLKNDFTLKVASQSPNSLQAAVLNVAAIGISLNPAQQHAYLVPRDGKICLDISYRGLTYLATESGAIKWAKVELVYENDDFKWRGPAERPKHEADPFSDRGEIKGGYCLAMLPDDSVMVEVMHIDEINKIRNTSKAYSKKGGPWVDWYEEMAKKTVLKRAAKSWPQTPSRRRIDAAVEVLHESEGMRYSFDEHDRYMTALKTGDALGFIVLKHELGVDKWVALFNSFPQGQKTANKQKARELEVEGENLARQIVTDLESCAAADDAHGAMEVLQEVGDCREYIMALLNPETAQFVEGVPA